MKNALLVLCAAVLLSAIVASAVVILGSGFIREATASAQQQNTADTGHSADGTNAYFDRAPASYISIPGFDSISMQAGETVQSVQLYNPANNGCYFLIALVLPDGREIYRSDMLAPGDTLSSIQLNTPLDPGTYSNAELVYSCYSVSGLQTMNGASVKFTLEVV